MADREIIRPPFKADFPNITEAGFKYLQQLAALVNERAYSPRGFFNMRSTKTITGVATAQSLANDTGATGSRTMRPKFLKAGTVLRFYLSGIYTTDASSGTAVLTLKLGSTTISTTGAFGLDSNVNSGIWRIFGQLTCRSDGATGTVVGQTGWEHDAENALEVWHHQNMIAVTPVTIDTTKELAVDVLWTASDAGTSITCTGFSLERVFD